MPESHRPDIRSDAELLAAHVAGDREAFGVLFVRHRDRLWAVALRTMSNPEDAADGLQDGMVAAYRRAGSFRGEAAVTTWLHRVVVNACLDRIRAAKVRRAEPLPDDLEEYGDRGSHDLGHRRRPRTPPTSPCAASAGGRCSTRCRTLPEEQRAALVLVDMEGYPVAEAAQMLKCAVGTVKSRCSRGRARLAVLLVDLMGNDAATEPPEARNHPVSPPVHPRSPPERHPSRADRSRPDQPRQLGSTDARRARPDARAGGPRGPPARRRARRGADAPGGRSPAGPGARGHGR